MATTGEECLHQQPIHNYFDGGYDLIFDAAREHYCTHFRKAVTPAQACGACCSAFQPLRGTPPPIQLMAANANEALANDVRVRAFLRQRLKEVCNELEENANYLELQIPTRERRWRETDVWLSRQDTQPEILGHKIAETERELSVALAELQRLRRQLDSAKAKLSGSRDLERLRLEQERLERKTQHARQAQQCARDSMVEREKKEAEQDQLYARWEDALKRVPLLKHLRVAVIRRVETWLERSQPLSDSEAEQVMRFLHRVSAYSTDDVPIPILQKVVQHLSDGVSAT